MSESQKPIRVVFLHTVAGGGHTSAARAIIEALHLRYGDRVECEMIDALKDYAPRPFNLAPEAYGQIIKTPQLYKQVYELSDGKRRSQILNQNIGRVMRRYANQMLDNHPADVIVSTYHFSNSPVLDALARRDHPIPFVNVVTDLVTIPSIWFDRRADAIVVPTEPALHQAIISGMPRERVHKIGLPVSPRFVATKDKEALRRQFGWPVKRPIVLLMAGGAGVGPLGKLAEAIVSAGLNATPVVITGKNKRLAARLRQEEWASSAMIYDFVDTIPEFMQAADILVTKAGPGTIAEALNTHLPMILYSQIPGQEEGNVEYVTNTGAGYWAPKTKEFVATLRYLLTDPEALEQAGAAAARLSTPKATDTIAQLIMQTAITHAKLANRS